ncbi:MAG TPA: portal protein, partial [Bryobacteraceae bacterium]|nr:portal protein [Bryobacteraceae bacterium]
MANSSNRKPQPASKVAQPDRAGISVTVGQGSAPRQDRGQQQDFASFLSLARERFKAAADAEAEVRRDFLEDLQFYAGRQWPDQIEAERLRAGRPCLTINRLPQFARLVINEQRQARPAIQINPVEDGDTDTAQILQGLVRHIETHSQADIAYDTAFQYAVIGGFGYFRVVTDYVNDRTFDQDIFIRRILDPTTVYFDPGAVEPDYSDADYCFIVEKLTREQFRARYPNSEVAGLPDFTSIGDTDRLWIDGPRILVAEYFFVERRKDHLVLLVDGREIPEKELERYPEVEIAVDSYGEPRTRETEERIIHWCKMNAREILEPEGFTVERLMSRPQVPGKYIPVIPVLGEELIVDGHRKLVGICRYAKDPQRQYNYMRSAVTEMIALAPKAPYVAAEGQIEGHEWEWENANRINIGVLQYKPTTVH